MPFNFLYQRLSRIRNRHFFAIDLLAFSIIPLLAIVVRFDLIIDFSQFLPQLIYAIFLFVVIKLFVLTIFGFYNRLWQVASIDDMLKLLVIGTNAFMIQFAVFLVFNRLQIFGLDLLPLSLPLIDGVFSLAHLGLSRFSIRMFKRADEKLNLNSNAERVLIVGAGQAGVMVASEIEQSPKLNQQIVGFVDDDVQKIGYKLRGIPVLGDRDDIPEIVKQYRIEKVFIAMPSIAGKEIREIVNICQPLEIEILTLPGLYDIIDGKVDYNRLRKVQIEDLLRREPIETDLAALKDLIRHKNILVTGGGGSIGGEICRQLLRNNPNELFILGHGENSVFEITAELKSKYPVHKITPIIADVSDHQRLINIFQHNKIDFIFHAAAHKHVPLMEEHPYEAIKNNVLGTKNLVDVAVRFDIEKMIMISTDKAVNPTNVMGASKRTSEMVVIGAAKKHNKKFSVVRFGNVLGSRGSVIRTFQKQIEARGPITITHPDIIRFFMTIPEAVQLVLQAFILGNSSEVFVLDMGKPVKIIDLAEDLVRLSGLDLGVDIDIIFTGLRPGEKLYEELFIEGENYIKTVNEKIFLSENVSKCITPGFDEKLEQLIGLIKGEKKSNEHYRSILQMIVPEYTPKPIEEIPIQKQV